jgi:hypothetical protein
MVSERNVVETTDEKRRRLGRERTRKHRAKNEAPKEIEDFTEISEKWMRNDALLLMENPGLHTQLLARHDEVVCLEAEVAEIEKGIQIRLRAETLSALTPDQSEIVPMPDLSFRDLRVHALTNGTANYRAIEAASIKGEPLDEVSRYYEKYGFRLRIQSDTLQTAREMLVLYSLRTHDQNLNWEIAREAIADCSAYHPRFSPNADELRKLIQEHLSVKAPVAEAPMPVEETVLAVPDSEETYGR